MGKKIKYPAWWVGIGIAVGAGVGATVSGMSNADAGAIAIGAGVGVVFGALLAGAIYGVQKRKHENND